MGSLWARTLLRTVREMLRSPTVQLSAISSVALSVGVLAAWLVVHLNLDQAALRLAGDTRLVAVLELGLSPHEQATLQAQLGAWPEVERAQLTTPEQALEELRSALGPQAPPQQDARLLPASLELTVATAQRTPEALRALAARLEALPGVRVADAGLELVEDFTRVRAVLNWIGLVLGSLALLAVLFIVNNTLRLALYARRDELHIMSLVGATHATIRGPYYIEGALQAGLGALAGVGVIYGLFELVAPASRVVGLDFLNLTLVWPPASWWGALIAATALLGVLVSHFATRRALRRLG